MITLGTLREIPVDDFKDSISNNSITIYMYTYIVYKYILSITIYMYIKLLLLAFQSVITFDNQFDVLPSTLIY